MNKKIIGGFLMSALLTLTGFATEIILPDYHKIDLTQKDQHPFLRTPARALKIPLSEEDLKDAQILEKKFDQEEIVAGLAAPQIGILKRMFVFAVPDDPELKKWRPDLTQTIPKSLWINPSWKPLDKEAHEDYEACFSVEGVAGLVKRYKRIRYQAYDTQGNLISGEAEGFMARVIQHEVDHLDGKLFIDYVEPGQLLSMEEYQKKRTQALKEKTEKVS